MLTGIKLNNPADWPTFLLNISEVLCSNLGLETYCPKFLSAHFPYSEKKSRLMRSTCSLCVCVSLASSFEWLNQSS
jgi:hypothetical protein